MWGNPVGTVTPQGSLMDLNHILFLVALLNLAGDLYNILKFRKHLPRWLLGANLTAITVCVGARLLAPQFAGILSLTVLLVYVLVVKMVGAPPASARPRPLLSSRSTKFLIIINFVSFIYQMTVDSTASPRQLLELGAMFGPAVEAGEWWRLFTAQFLHWGLMHLMFNMLGLWLLGPPVESKLGSGRFVCSYLFCGAGGMLFAWLTALLSGDPDPAIMVGASASVLSLVGVEAAMALKTYRATGSISAKAQLAAMTQIVVLQAIFDSMVPQVSSTAHLGGAACGFAVGLALRPRTVTSSLNTAQLDLESQPQP